MHKPQISVNSVSALKVTHKAHNRLHISDSRVLTVTGFVNEKL